jgi:hypothetical protein
MAADGARKDAEFLVRRLRPAPFGMLLAGLHGRLVIRELPPVGPVV